MRALIVVARLAPLAFAWGCSQGTLGPGDAAVDAQVPDTARADVAIRCRTAQTDAFADASDAGRARRPTFLARRDDRHERRHRIRHRAATGQQSPPPLTGRRSFVVTSSITVAHRRRRPTRGRAVRARVHDGGRRRPGESRSSARTAARDVATRRGERKQLSYSRLARDQNRRLLRRASRTTTRRSWSTVGGQLTREQHGTRELAGRRRHHLLRRRQHVVGRGER